MGFIIELSIVVDHHMMPFFQKLKIISTCLCLFPLVSLAVQPVNGMSQTPGSADTDAQHEQPSPLPPNPAAVPNTTVAPITVHAFRGVTVTAKEKCFRLVKDGGGIPPHVIGTYPKNGETVAPGILILRITFDQEMSCGYSLVQYVGIDYVNFDYPPCAPPILIYPGRRIFKFKCNLKPNRRYLLSLNSKDWLHFQNVWADPLAPVKFGFATNNQKPTLSVHDSLMADPDYPLEQSAH
ncbi:MAG: hypothetical protein WA840_15320 [Caulobacteraceae bacterium]